MKKLPPDHWIYALDEREKSVLRLRYGEDKAQKQIAIDLNISQQMVSRIENRALCKIGERLLLPMKNNGLQPTHIYRVIFGSKSADYIVDYRHLAEAISTIPDDRTRLVFILCCSGYSTKFVGSVLGIGKTRVSCLKKEAARLLRHPSRRRYFHKLSI